MISGPILTAAASLFGILLLLLAGVLAWMIRKLLGVESEVEEISTSYGGGEYDEGHLAETQQNFNRMDSRLDDLEDMISYSESRRIEEHQEVRSMLSDIVDVLRDEGINGDLDDIQPSDD